MLEQHPQAEPACRVRLQLSDETLIASRQLRELLGCCSEMHIWRLLNRAKNQALAFPKPIKINDRNYWRLGAIRQWIMAQEANPQESKLRAPQKLGGRRPRKTRYAQSQK